MHWLRRLLSASSGAVPDYSEFLPAALELRARAPDGLAHRILRAVLLLVVLALAWACIGRTDIVAVASGRVIPDGRSKPVQSAQAGTVVRLHVREGQAVGQGDLLLELDGTDLDIERRRLERELRAEQAALAGAVALLAALDGEAPALAALLDAAWHAENGGSPRTPAARDRAMLDARWREQHDEQRMLRARADARVNALAALQAEWLKLERTLPIIREQALGAEGLYRRDLLARRQWQELDMQLATAEQAQRATRGRMQAERAEHAAIVAESAARRASRQREVMAEIDARRRAASGLRHDLDRVQEHAAQRYVLAPCAGEVQQLAVRGPGAVVRPAETLLVVVPAGAALEVEALVRNRDIGFVQRGQNAVVKVDAFNFTRYGTLPGRVSSLAAEAVEDPRLGLVYPARIALARAVMDIEGGRRAIAPGMAVQVEIRTGSRRIIDYFLSPFDKVVSESIRER